MEMSSSLQPTHNDVIETDGSGLFELKAKLRDRVVKNHVQLSASTSTITEGSASGLELYSTFSGNINSQHLNSHFYFRDTPVGVHYHRQGLPSLVWFGCVNTLLTERLKLTILRKLYHQQYYTKQFLFKLQHFLFLQISADKDVCFYQSLSLSGEQGKPPKLHILCKQIVSLLNDYDSCCIDKISKTFNIDKQAKHCLVSLALQYKTLYNTLLIELVQCVRTLRDIIVYELRFCFLFSNYRSRLYSIIDNVIKFNETVFHPAVFSFLRDPGKLVISLEDMVDVNVKVAAWYIARSFHYKITAAHLKSVPTSSSTSVIPECGECQVCAKLTVFLHKYCANKCGVFVDAISLMLQGAGDNRIICKTDTCTSRHVEVTLSRDMSRALYHQANSSVYYENRLECGDSKHVTIHEMYSDKSKCWEDNFTSVIYTCMSRGLPNTWSCLYDIPGIQYTVSKLDPHHTSFYSSIASNHGKILQLGYLASLQCTGLEDVLELIQLDSVRRDKISDVILSHLNKLSYLVFTDNGVGRDEVYLLISYTVHMEQITQYLYRGYSRVLNKHRSGGHFTQLFVNMMSLHELHTFLSTLYTQLTIPEDRLCKVPPFLRRSLISKLQSVLASIGLLKDLLDDIVGKLKVQLYASVKETVLTESPPLSYWKKDVHDTIPSPYIAKLLGNIIKPISTSCSVLPEPYLTRVHHHLLNSTASVMIRHIIGNKKITFSKSGTEKLEGDVQTIVSFVKSKECTALQTAEVLLSTHDMLRLRNELNVLASKSNKYSGKGAKCSCDKQGKWKRMSAPQLCSNCSSARSSSMSVERPRKVASSMSREIFSDSEIGSDAVSNHLKQKQRISLSWKQKQKLDISKTPTM